jgi:hypothetical protein
MDTLALLVSVAAFAVSVLSWLASIHENRAVLFDRRFEVYRDAEAFIAAWQRHGRPDLALLGKLVDAWNRSHFLFEADVTKFLREVWLDAVKADYCNKVFAGEAVANAEETAAVPAKMLELNTKYLDSERLRDAFLPHLKVSDGNLKPPHWLSRLRLTRGATAAPGAQDGQ